MRAITNGTLWVLEREAFRGILLMKYMNRPSLKTLRSINIFSKLSLSHLHRLAEALTEVSFSAGDTVVHQVSARQGVIISVEFCMIYWVTSRISFL